MMNEMVFIIENSVDTTNFAHDVSQIEVGVSQSHELIILLKTKLLCWDGHFFRDLDKPS